MWSFLKKRLANEEGAMDKILVTLLLVVVGVAAVVGLTSWMDGQKNSMTNAANGAVNKVLNNANNAS